MPPTDNSEHEVKQAEVVGGLLGPADQDGAKAVQPGMRPLHHPAPGLGPSMTFGPGFLAPTAQVQGEAELVRQGTRLLVVEALVEAEVLGPTPGRYRPVNGDSVQR